MFESMIHDIEEDSKKSSGVHSNRQSSILVDVVVNQGNDTLEARGIVENRLCDLWGQNGCSAQKVIEIRN